MMATTRLHLTVIPPRVKKGEHVHAGNLLSVEEARELVDIVRRRPWAGETTVVHITAAHRTSDLVWNTLLKSLEEPPSYVQWHLYAVSTDGLPRTIRSRSLVSRESLPTASIEDSSRLVRLYTSADALAIIREGDRYNDQAEALRAVEGLWVDGVQTGKLNQAFLAESSLTALRRGASPRVILKSLLLQLAIAYKQAQA